jgi:hypothetical protein
MDSRLLFLHRCGGGKGGTREVKSSIPIGHGVSLIRDDAGAGKSTPDIVESERKLRGDPRRFD